eukprot:CAMPEP_0205802170 /NCGR_PEP_ID=MMETSP0205-20121125/4398_1 /ASSEMBLY_ACC=CAM_ASM_000278 /TAXON_ID=36767 /ORGANISM="Euplotes focardii, Strain TN1" /LENGTH=58 /DNA_ID=CAMNT_0053068129 /DNA_START=265 /DNA_END=438 /DNA_ORIENTATION=+
MGGMECSLNESEVYSRYFKDKKKSKMYPGYFKDEGDNLMLLSATIKNHDERKAFWRKK